jgi:hypothetical protein
MDTKPREVWDSISLSQWKELLSASGAGSSWSIRGNTLVGCCPFPGHHDNSPSCHIVPAKGFVKCFGCNKYESNPIKFLATVSKQTWAGALRLLSSQGLKLFTAKEEAELNAAEKLSIAKNELASACNRILVLASQNRTDPKYLFAQPCVNYLEKRGVKASTFSNLPIGVLAPSILLNQQITSHNAVEEYISKQHTANYIGGLVYFYHKSPSDVSRFKIRADFLRHDTSIKDEIYITDNTEEDIGFFGLANFTAQLGVVSKSVTPIRAMLVEGEFDTLAHLTNYVESGITYEIVLGVGGGSAASADKLKQFGIDNLLVVTDHPTANGNTIAKNIIRNTTLSTRVFNWPDVVKAKDPHEAIETHGWQTWINTISQKHLNAEGVTVKTHFSVAYEWLASITKQALTRVQTDDIPEIKRILGENGSCIKDPDSQRLFCIAMSKSVSLTLGSILEVVIGQDDTEEGFVARIMQALRDEFYFVGIDGSSGSDSTIRAWHRAKREPREWKTARTNELFSRIVLDLGPAVSWLRGKVGVPHSLTVKKGAKGSTSPISLVEQDTNLKRYMGLAIDTIASELPTISSLTEIKAGAHYLKGDFGSGEENFWAVVNGHSVYTGRYDSGGNINWQLQDGPRVGKFYFNIIRAPWSTEINGSKDLQLGSNFNLEETYDFLVSVIRKGWDFDGGIEDCEYLAAAMMINPISSCLPRQIYTLINGERSTGKSSLLELIAGKDRRIRLLESTSDTQTSYTAAGFRKDMNNCALGAVLDEFEDKGDDRHSHSVRDILTDIRSLTNSTESRITRGNADSKEATVYTLKCQVWACSIQYLRDEADISRFMQLQTVRVEDKANPLQSILDAYGEESFVYHRRSLTTGIYAKVPKLLQYLHELRQHYNDTAVKDALASRVGHAVPSRFLDGVIITAALIKLVGRDPHDYIYRVVYKKIGLITRISHATHSEDLLDQVLSSRVEYKRPGSDVRSTAVRTVLSDPLDRNKLQELDCGLAYAEYTDGTGGTIRYIRILIVMWPDVLANLFSRNQKFSRETSDRLKRMGDSNKSSLKYNTVRKKLNGLSSYLRAGITANDITIYDITEMLNTWDRRMSDEP